MKAKIMIMIGWMCVGLGMIGIVVPLLPTTPFILLAGYLFSKNSKKYEVWLKSTTVYNRYVVPFRTKRGLTMRTKIEITLSSYIILFISGLVVSHLYIRIMLVSIAFGHLLLMIRIPTIRRKEESTNSERKIS